jgi:hypothetical protein
LLLRVYWLLLRTAGSCPLALLAALQLPRAGPGTDWVEVLGFSRRLSV